MVLPDFTTQTATQYKTNIDEEMAANKTAAETNKTKLDSIENNATADQSNSEIKTAYEANANTNAFTNAEKSTLANQSGTNTGDMSNAQVKTAYELNANTNGFSDALLTKLNGIAAGAQVNKIFRGCLVEGWFQLIPTSVNTRVQMTNVSYDTDGIHQVVDFKSRLVVPAGVSKIRLTGSLGFVAGNSIGVRAAGIYKNGSDTYNPRIRAGFDPHDQGFDGQPMTLAGPVMDVWAGDYFYINAFQSSGVSIRTAANYDNWLAMEIIG